MKLFHSLLLLVATAWAARVEGPNLDDSVKRPDVDLVSEPGETPLATEEGHYVTLPSDSDFARHAAQEVTAALQRQCESASVSHVRAAAAKVENGVRVWLEMELAPNAVHRVEVQFWPGYWKDPVDSSKSEIHWPNAAEEGLCHLLEGSSQGAGKSLVQLTPDQSLAHQRAARSSAPVASFAQMESLVRTSTPEAYDARQAKPECFSGRRAADIVLSQGACGSCWAFASMGALGDRHCMTTPPFLLKRDGRRHTLSVQQMLSCHHRDGCNGGYLHTALDTMLKQGVKATLTDEYPYEARCFEDRGGVVQNWGHVNCFRYSKLPDHDVRKPCECVRQRISAQPLCDRSKLRNAQFTIVDHAYMPPPGQAKHMWSRERWTLNEVVNAIMAEIVRFGPVTTGFDTYEDFSIQTDRNPRSIYWHRSGRAVGGHAAVMVGYGSERSVPYWMLRNSWGIDWGDGGHWRHIRGNNDCNIESQVNTATIKPLGAPGGPGPERPQRNSFRLIEAHVSKFVEEGVVQTPNIMERTVGLFKGEGAAKRYGKDRLIWELEVKCSAPCQATNAVMLGLFPRTDPPSDWGKCCCDDKHYKPAKCSLIDERELPRDFFLRPKCGMHNLGRGRILTFDGGSKRCERDAWDSRSREGTFLPVQNTDDTTLVTEIDLTEHQQARGKVRVRVQAQQLQERYNRFDSAKAEQTYEVEIFSLRTNGKETDAEGRSGKATEVFELVDLDTKFEYKAESYQAVEDGIRYWRVQHIPQVQLILRCSLPCRPSAVFSDLDSSSHHDPDVIYFNLEESLNEKTTWVLTANIEDFPPGDHKVDVRVYPLDGREHDYPSRQLTVTLPSVSDTQGKAFQQANSQEEVQKKEVPMELELVDLSTSATAPDENGDFKQTLLATCNVPCRITSVEFSSNKVFIEEGEAQDSSSRVTYSLHNKNRKKTFVIKKTKFGSLTLISTASNDKKWHQRTYRLAIQEGGGKVSFWAGDSSLAEQNLVSY